MEKFTAVNLNDYVHVRLTDFGKQVYTTYYLILTSDIRYPDIEIPEVEYDDEGMAVFQLWEFIHIFGEYIYMEAPNVIEPITLFAEGRV